MSLMTKKWEKLARSICEQASARAPAALRLVRPSLIWATVVSVDVAPAVPVDVLIACHIQTQTQAKGACVSGIDVDEVDDYSDLVWCTCFQHRFPASEARQCEPGGCADLRATPLSPPAKSRPKTPGRHVRVPAHVNHSAADCYACLVLAEPRLVGEQSWGPNCSFTRSFVAVAECPRRPIQRSEAVIAHAVARGATVRRQLVNVRARTAAPARKPMLHQPAHWPWQTAWKTLWDNVIGHQYPTAQPRR
jgi:hypothetical protein